MKKKTNNLESGVDELRKITMLATSDGNWNYDPYLFGMANGLILALATMQNKEPEFLEAPEVWLCDLEGE